MRSRQLQSAAAVSSNLLQLDAVRSNQRQSAAIGSNQQQSATISSNQQQSAAIITPTCERACHFHISNKKCGRQRAKCNTKTRHIPFYCMRIDVSLHMLHSIDHFNNFCLHRFPVFCVGGSCAHFSTFCIVCENGLPIHIAHRMHFCYDSACGGG